LHKQILMRRGAALCLTLALALSLSAFALAAGEKKTETSDGAPVARELELSTYRNIPYRAEFLTSGGAAGSLTFQLDREPKHGTVEVNGAGFVYTPENGRTGKDSFTYVVTDSAGKTSQPAEVSVTVKKTKSGVTYADTNGSAAAAAAQQMAESGVFTGAKIGGRYFFEPDRTVSRSEFLAMTMEAVGLPEGDAAMTGFCDDESIPAWAKAYAASGLTDGVVQGVATADGVAFRGSDAVTFNEAAAILNRVLAVNDVDLSAWYADRNATPSWAAQAVGNMESVSVLAAGSFGSPAMNKSVPRADAAQMLAAAQTLQAGEKSSPFDWLR